MSFGIKHTPGCAGQYIRTLPINVCPHERQMILDLGLEQMHCPFLTGSFWIFSGDSFESSLSMCTSLGYTRSPGRGEWYIESTY